MNFILGITHLGFGWITNLPTGDNSIVQTYIIELYIIQWYKIYPFLLHNSYCAFLCFINVCSCCSYSPGHNREFLLFLLFIFSVHYPFDRIFMISIFNMTLNYLGIYTSLLEIIIIMIKITWLARNVNNGSNTKYQCRISLSFLILL